MREGGRLLAEAVRIVIDAVRPGVTTAALDDIFVSVIGAMKAESSFLGYHGYPKTICTSVNDQVVHAIPGDRTLQEGDIIGIDCGIRYKGFCTDMARTVPVGAISSDAQQLIDATRESLARAIALVREGACIGDIGATVQEHVEALGYSVVRDLVGHGVGESVHEPPPIPNYGTRGRGERLRAGMVIAIEPMVNIGSPTVVFSDDGWTVRTEDGTLSAHFEDTIAVTQEGFEILTHY